MFPAGAFSTSAWGSLLTLYQHTAAYPQQGPALNRLSSVSFQPYCFQLFREITPKKGQGPREQSYESFRGPRLGLKEIYYRTVRFRDSTFLDLLFTCMALYGIHIYIYIYIALDSEGSLYISL